MRYDNRKYPKGVTVSLKMSELVQLSETPKSTILYYIKEGLLPEPIKLKPNVHRYPEDFVERIRLIRYLQHHFHASIEQIRALMRREDFDASRGFEAALEQIGDLMAPSDPVRYDKAALCEKAGISCKTLHRWIERGVIFLREGGFGARELETARILAELERMGIADAVLDLYLPLAKETARKEANLARAALAKADDRDTAAKTLFDTALILKPYLMNMHLAKAMQDTKGSS